MNADFENILDRAIHLVFNVPYYNPGLHVYQPDADEKHLADFSHAPGDHLADPDQLPASIAHSLLVQPVC